MGNSDVCGDIYSSYPASDYLPGVFGNVGIGGMVIGFVYFLSSAITIAWIRTQQQNALRGMEGAAKHVIFPIYLPIMWISALSDAFRGLVIFFVKSNMNGATSWENSVIIACAFGIQHFVIEGIAVILIQYGCGKRAIRTASIGGGAVGIFTFLAALFLYRDGGGTPASSIIYVCWLFALVVFYATLWLMPQEKLYRRPAVIFYAKFWTLLTGLVLIADGVNLLGPPWLPEAVTISNCVYNVIALPILVVFKPFVMYTTLLMESKWWQGLLIRPPETATSHLGSGSGSNRGSHSKATAHRHIRVIRSVDHALDLIANGDNNSNPDMSRGTSGSSTHESDLHSADCDLPRGFFASFYHMLHDALCGPCADGKSKYSSVSQRSDDETGDRPSTATADSSKSRGALAHLGAGLDTARKLFARRNYDQLKGPLLGVEVGFSEAQELAMEVDNLNTQGTVKLLNFAYLSLENKGKKLLGTGSFSKVYAGTYRNLPVAVKMLFTQDLNPDVIKRCSNEARILTEISPHPNVVHIFGVAVLPPSVCLVLEICEYGSLADVLRGGESSSAAATTSTSTRAPLTLTLSDRLFLALGCARGVQALHAYSPLLCHRDIKSYNFLIDAQLNAKIADLDLGYQYQQDPTIHTDAAVNTEDMSEAELIEHTNNKQKLADSKNVNANKVPVEVGGSNMCIYWQAPEVLLGQQYTQKSDIHSLALVIWEIVSAGKVTKFHTNTNREHSVQSSAAGHTRHGSGDGGSNQVCSTVSYGAVPYAECKTMKEVREKIVKGYRPTIPAAIGTPGSVKSITGGLTHPPDPILLEILQLGWHPDPAMRPDIDYIVEGLTRCWRNSLHTTIFETEFLVDLQTIQQENFKLTVLQDYNTTNRSRGSAITMASTFRGKSTTSGSNNIHNSSHGGMHAHTVHDSSTHSGSGNNSANSSLTGSLSTYSRSQGQQRIVRKPPSPEVIASLLLMKSEPCWSKLEDEGAYLVLTPLRPFYMLWATRKWTQLTGYLVNDVIAYDVRTLLGPKADHFAFEECLENVGMYGRAEHIVSTIYRRDGKAMSLSVHMFPVFDSSRDAYYPDTGTHSMDSSYRVSGHSATAVGRALQAQDPHTPGRMSFSRFVPPNTPSNTTHTAQPDQSMYSSGNNHSVYAGRSTSTGSAEKGTVDPYVLSQLLTSTTPVQIRTPIKVRPGSGVHSSVGAANSGVGAGVGGGAVGSGAVGGGSDVTSGATGVVNGGTDNSVGGNDGISAGVVDGTSSTGTSTTAGAGLAVTITTTTSSTNATAATSPTPTTPTRKPHSTYSPKNSALLSPDGRRLLSNNAHSTSNNSIGSDTHDADSGRILDRIYSPVHSTTNILTNNTNTSTNTTNTASPRRSTSNVYTTYNNQSFQKIPGIVPLSRSTSHAGSQSGDDSSVVGISNMHDAMHNMSSATLFNSYIDDESSQRRVAYIAVQFSSIKDNN